MRAIPFACVLLLASSASAQGWESVPDEPVERTAEHYPETNERAHSLYYPVVAGRGGGYLGVGSQQSYSIAAAQGADPIVLVDYDPVVTRLHRALVVLVASCPDVACLRARLRPESERESAAAIATALGDGWSAQRTTREFRVHRPLLARRIDELGREESWVSRDDWYTHIRGLARRGRIIARIADLRGDATLPAVARVARAEGVSFRVVYLSNAEEYFSYGPQFLQNVSGLPHPEDAVVLRTLRDRRLPRASGDSMWHYDVEPLDDLVTRIRDHGYADSSWIVNDLLRSEVAHGPDGSSRLDARTPAAAAPSSRRWWLEQTAPRPPSGGRARGPSRMLVATRRAILPALDPTRQRQVRALDLEGSGLSRLRDARLPPDPRTGAAFVLSGEPGEAASTLVPEPENNLQAMLLDALAREVLPTLYARAGADDVAASLREAPAAADLYAAYRMRERLLEVCPPGARAAGPLGRATRACRHASRMVQPVPTARARPSWSSQQARLGRSVRGVAREASADPEAADALVAALGRLAAVATAISE
ncbi:MAG: hypothetical protein H6719_18660 [Sandaracinaceae bacterium]|nr:hypothetical protein [Sandaracinaceae bacterium]